MRRAVIVGACVVGIGVVLQLVFKIVSVVAGLVTSGNLAGDAGFFAAFLGLATVPLALLLIVLAGIGRLVRARQDARFFTRAIWAAVAAVVVALGLLLAGAGELGGGIIPH